jgi:toxin secretion/phage lysis holin
MNNIIRTIQTAAAAIGAIVGTFLGGFDGVLISLLIFIGLDIATGILRAGVEKKVNSTVSFRGMCKKVAILLLVGLAWCIDLYVIKTGGVVRTAVIFFYIANEGISILENSAIIGLPIPAKLKDALEQLKEKNESTDKTEEK